MSIQGALLSAEERLWEVRDLTRLFSRIPVFYALYLISNIPVAIYNFPLSFVISIPKNTGKDLWETPLKAVYHVALVVLRTASLPTNLVHAFAYSMNFTEVPYINQSAYNQRTAKDSSGEFLSIMQADHKNAIKEIFASSFEKGRLTLAQAILKAESYRVGYVFLETIDYLKQFAQCLWNLEFANAHVLLQKLLERVVLLPLAILAWLPAIVTKTGTLCNPLWNPPNEASSRYYYINTITS